MADPIVDRLRDLLGDTAVVADAEGMAAHLGDWRGRYRGAARCVVKPATTDQVAAAVALLAGAGIPIVPQGGNTSLCGGATPDGTGSAVLINLSRMDRIRDVDVANNTITVEAGCLLQRVQEVAVAAGRLFPLSLAAEGSTQIGGNLSTNAGGVHVLRYGTMRDLTLGLEVVLPDGRVWDGLRGLRKDNSGYDLKHLFIGAEGTLGIVTAAVLKLFPLPVSSAVAWVALPSVQAAVDLLGAMRGRFGERITAFELVGLSALQVAIRNIPDARAPLALTAPWYALIDVAETVPGLGLEGLLDAALTAELAGGHILDAVIAHNLTQAEDFWRLRENMSEAQRIEGPSIKHDIAVPVSRIPAFIERADSALAERFPALKVVAFGHVGDGNLHYNLYQPGEKSADRLFGQTAAVGSVVYDIVDELSGSISAEHGLGQLKRDEILRHKSDVEMDLMRRVK
ncbi:MAG: FAD-binding oxidoreductase, partial [Rhodocyclaceae bacterium]